MGSFNNFMQDHNLRNVTTNAKKILEVANKIGLKDFNIYIRTDKITTNQGVINLTNDYSRGTHWVCFKDHYYFDSFCTEPPTIISNQLTERHPKGICECYISSHPIQNINDSNCASYCLYFLFLMQDNSFYRTIMKILNDR